MSEDVAYTEQACVGVLTLDRPEVHNALRRRTYVELTELVRTTTARELFATEDHREGVRSFLEKREPHHVGR